MCLFAEGDDHHIKNPPQFWAIASKNNTTVLQRLPQFLKSEPFINAGSGLVLKYVTEKYMIKYIALEGKLCVLKWLCFLANVVSVVFFLCLFSSASMEGQ